MKNAIVMTAVAGIASAAAAQSGSFSIVPSVSTIDSSVSTNFTLSVYGDADFGTHIAGGEFALSATGGSMVNGMTGATAAWGALGLNDRGHTGGGNHAGLVFGQLIFPPFIDPDAASALPGPVLLGIISVSIDANSTGVINWTTAAGQGTFELEIYDSSNESFTQLVGVGAGNATVNVVVPAPSALALLGLGGLVAGRRRR